MADDSVLFCRSGEEMTNENIWDDNALIKAYDKAISIAKEEVSKRLGIESPEPKTNPMGSKIKQKTKQQSQKNHKKWCIGSPCRAVYSEDGELYEAVITKIFDDSKTCVVRFIGYNNIEKVKLASLLESEGLQSQIAQQKDAEADQETPIKMEFDSSHTPNGTQEKPMECEANYSKSFKNTYNLGSSFNPQLAAIPPAPPLPPQLMARLPENDEDALSSMLMSWYISGFHTGYYHGLKQAQKNQGQRKK